MTGFFELLLGRTCVEIPLPEGLGSGTAPQVILVGGRWRLEAGSSDLAIEGHVDIAFAGFPYLGGLLPGEDKPLSATLRLDEAQGLTARVEPDSKLELGIDLPTLHAGGNGQIPLGRMSGRIGGVGLKVPRNQGPSLDVVLSVTLPDGLNRILGGHEIFETRKPIAATVSLGVVEGKLGASLTLGDALAASPSQVTSPLKVLSEPLTWDGTDVSGRLDLGGAGAVQIKVPRLAFGDGTFVAHGGVELDPDKPLGLPLWLLKLPLRRLLGSAVDELPDYLPLQDLTVLNANGDLNVDKLDKFVAALGLRHESDLAKALTKALGDLKGVTQHLPERLKQYLQASPFVPGQKVDLDIEVSPVGSLEVRIECDPALRVLVPTSTSILGIELGTFSLGPILGGSLLRLEVDAQIDSFDLESLAVFLPLAVIGEKVERLKPWLPDVSSMQSTLILSELLAVIEFETVIPIPIALLARDLGLKFVGIGGLEVAGGVSCHLERDSISDLVETVGKLYRFITTDEPPLTQDDGRGLQLMVGVDATYLQLPTLLGGQVVGSKTRPLVPEEDAVAYAFRLLNALKKFSLAQLVSSIPLSRRVQAFDLVLGPARANGGVAVTTTDEFLAGFASSDVGAYPELRALSQDGPAAGRLLARIQAATTPVAGGAPRSGVVALAAGACRFGALSVAAQSAAALVGASAFAAAFHLDGVIAGLSLDLSGCAYFDLKRLSEQGAIGVEGTAALTLEQHVVCHGGITISGDRVTFTGSFDGTTLPLADVLVVDGSCDASLSNEGFSLKLHADATATLSLLGLSGAALDFKLDSSGLAAGLHGQIGSCACKLTLKVADLGRTDSGHITGTVTSDLSTWANHLRVEVTSLAEQAVSTLRGQIESQLAEHQQESWYQWVTSGHVVTDEELRLFDAYLVALQTVLQGGQMVGTFAENVVSEVLQRLGPLGGVITTIVAAGGSWAPSLTSARFSTDWAGRHASRVTLTIAGSLPGVSGKQWTFEANLPDLDSIIRGLLGSTGLRR